MKKNILLFIFFISSISYGQLVFSHRGGASISPENTLYAFETSIDLGVDYYELDVRVSSDDSLVIIHDATVDRTTNGTGSVSGMTFDELRTLDAGSWFDPNIPYEKIPTLEEALALAAPSNTGIIIEIKATTSTTIQKIINQVHKYNMQSKVIIAGFSFDNISAVKTIDSSIAVMQFANYSESAINNLNGIGGEWFGTSSGIAQTELDYAHSKNILLNKWTINSAEQMLELIELGVDAITTDYPQLLIALSDSTKPSDVILTSISANQSVVELTWEPAEDLESGIFEYEIFRDTIPTPTSLYYTTTNVTEFYDETHLESKTLYYRVKAKNLAGLTSENFSNELSVTTEADNILPTVSNIDASSENTKVIIRFSEQIDRVTAENISNYSINNSINVLNAKLSIDLYSVILTTSELEAIEYTLSLSNILDRAIQSNAILPETKISFNFKNLNSGVILHFGLDEIVNDSIYDAATDSYNGLLFNGPILADGILGNALSFDGIDDYVKITNSPSITSDAVSVSVWVNLDYLPTNLPSSYGPIFDSETDNYVIYEDRGNSELRFKVTTVNGAERPGIPNDDLLTGEWLHVVGVYDGASAMVYLNSELKDTHEGITGNVKPGQSVKLGESLNSFFKGKMDNIQVFNYPLSVDEIDSIFQSVNGTLVSVNENPKLTSQFELAQNYPNPFNPTTSIKYSIPKSGLVTLKVYNILGQEVVNLVNKIQTAGNHSVSFDASLLSAGVYIYRMQAIDFSETKKMVFLK